jgi:hypothetical protein
MPVIEKTIEMAALMLGSDRSRGYCLELTCADFLAGANPDNGDPETLLFSMTRFFGFCQSNNDSNLVNASAKRNHDLDSSNTRTLAAGSDCVRESAPAGAAPRRLAVSIMRHDVEPGSPSPAVPQSLGR